MVLLNDAVEAKKLDTRVVERNVQRGFVKPEEVDKAVKALPDDAENAEYIAIESLMADGSEDDAGTSSH